MSDCIQQLSLRCLCCFLIRELITWICWQWMFECEVYSVFSKFQRAYCWLVTDVFTSMILNLLSCHSLPRKKKGNDNCNVDGQRQDLVLDVTRPYEVELVSLPGVKVKNHKWDLPPSAEVSIELALVSLMKNWILSEVVVPLFLHVCLGFSFHYFLNLIF